MNASPSIQGMVWERVKEGPNAQNQSPAEGEGSKEQQPFHCPQMAARRTPCRGGGGDECRQRTEESARNDRVSQCLL